MGCELDELMWEGWLRVRERVLGDERELHRRLERRQKMFERVPRALCFALRAGDRRINECNAWLSGRHPMRRGGEVEHDVMITSQLIRELCRPVEPCWGQGFDEVARLMGSSEGAPRRLERQGVIVGRRVQGLRGRWGINVMPLVNSPVLATEGEEKSERYWESLRLDPGARGYRAPDPLLRPYWEGMTARLPDDIEVMLRRRPVRWIRSNGQPQREWTWVCPSCGREAWTVYLPAGGPDWVAMHGIELPKVGWFEPPYQPRCFGCQDCHGLFSLSRRTKWGLSAGWSNLIGHMSGGLLYGREVERPAWFGVVRGNRCRARPRPAPRRDELERYLVDTDLSTEEIARRMGWMRESVMRAIDRLCEMRGVKGRGREELREWWRRKREMGVVAA